MSENWYENDNLWSGFSGLMFTKRREVEAAKNVTTSPLLQFPAGTRVLDLCCGPGVYLVPLAAQGHTVTGVDINTPMLDRATKASADAGVPVELVTADMGEFVRPGGFDVVLNMYTSFGYFEEPERNLQVLRNVHTSLAPGGQLLMEVFSKEFLASKGLNRPQVVDVPEGQVFVRNTILNDWSRLHTEWTMVRDGMARSASLTSFIYSAAELKDLFAQAGFSDIECFGGFDGRSYDLRAKTLIVRGKKN